MSPPSSTKYWTNISLSSCHYVNRLLIMMQPRFEAKWWTSFFTAMRGLHRAYLTRRYWTVLLVALLSCISSASVVPAFCAFAPSNLSLYDSASASFMALKLLLPALVSVPYASSAGVNKYEGVVNYESHSETLPPKVKEKSSEKSSAANELTEEQKRAISASISRIKARRGAVELRSLEEYKRFLTQHPLSMVLYYAPWCEWSRQAMPEFDAVALMLIHHEPAVILARVNAAPTTMTEESVGNEENITAFPTVRLYVDGRMHPYPGRVLRIPLNSWMQEKLERDHKLHSSVLVDEFMGNVLHGLLIVAGLDGEELTRIYARVGRQFGDDVLFAHIEDAKVREHFEKKHVQRLLDAEASLPSSGEKDIAWNNVLLEYALGKQPKRPAGDRSADSESAGTDAIAPALLSAAQRERREKILAAVRQPPFVLAFSNNPDERMIHLYDGNPSDFQQLEIFVSRHQFPLVTLLDISRIPHNFFTDPRPKAILFLDTRADREAVQTVQSMQRQLREKDVDSLKSKDPLIAIFLEKLQKYRHTLSGLVSGNRAPQEKHLMELLSVEEDALPAIRVFTVVLDNEGRLRPGKKFKPFFTTVTKHAASGPSAAITQTETTGTLPADSKSQLESAAAGAARYEWQPQQHPDRNNSANIITPELLGAFLEEFAAGKIQPYYRSEAVPEEDDLQRHQRGIVRTVVGVTFQRVVMDSDDDVLVEFYAPWCGHCRKFEPVYKELAARLRDVDGIIVAKVDGNRNELPDIRITAYPTLLLFPAKSKKRQQNNATAGRSFPYDGDRTVRRILEWISKRVEKAQINVEKLLRIDLNKHLPKGQAGDPAKSVLEEL